jgi:cyclophilin family peptidyl-prolyl cis-trans isomerase
MRYNMQIRSSASQSSMLLPEYGKGIIYPPIRVSSSFSVSDPKDPYAPVSEYGDYPPCNDADSSGAPLSGYGGSRPIPQHYELLATQDQPRVRTFSFCAVLKSTVLVAITFCAGTLVGQYYSSRLPDASTTRDSLMLNQERLLLDLAKSKRLPKENKEIMEHVALLKDELDRKGAALQEEIRRRHAAEDEVAEAWGAYQTNSAQIAGIEKQYEDDMSKLSRTLAEKYYGKGPHYAQITVIIPTEGGLIDFFFTLEMAPLNLMPASVFTFMEQAEAGAWDGTCFHINAPHALFAQPVSVAGDYSNLPRMEAMGLARLPFPEYNEEYPHDEYTVGFSGTRRSGPNFYINKVDNSINHAGEPCFSKVIIGHDVVDWLSRQEGPPNDPFFMDPIEIKSIRVLGDISEAVGSEVYIRALQATERKQDLL